MADCCNTVKTPQKLEFTAKPPMLPVYIKVFTKGKTRFKAGQSLPALSAVWRGAGETRALVAAYRHYGNVCEPPQRISFDRAFDLAAHTDGLWLTSVQSFSLVACPTCHSEYLAAYGSAPRSNDECPFCKLVQRYGTDQRVQASFPVRPLPDLSELELGLHRLLNQQQTR